MSDNPLRYGTPYSDPNNPLSQTNDIRSQMDRFNALALGPMYVPRDPGPQVEAGAGSPFDIPAPQGGRNLPSDNYRKPLDTYAPTLYRQTNPGDVRDFVPGMNTRDMTNDETYFADHPDLALGQGGNANGVLMAFDASGIHGRVNQSKPSFAPTWQSGYGEYVGTKNDQSTYQDALTALRIPTDLRMSGLERRQLQNATLRLQAAGWDSQERPGYVEYTRPPPSQ